MNDDRLSIHDYRSYDGRFTCPLWFNWHGIVNKHCGEVSLSDDGMVVSHNCFRSGGAYQVASHLLPHIDGIDDSGYEITSGRVVSQLVEQRILGVDIPTIPEYVVEDLEGLRSLPVDIRAIRLLRFFAEQTPMVGREVVIDSNDKLLYAAYAWSESCHEEELRFLVDYLQSERLVVAEFYGGRFDVTVTVDGFLRLKEDSVSPKASQVFVAMWFDPSMSDVYEQGIRVGVRGAGYRPLRIDRKTDVNKIDDEIITEIRRSRCLVADMTHGDDGVRGGVYYEAGFAHGLALPVIYSCRLDQVDRLHFDTRQYYHIIWSDPTQLASALTTRLGALIGSGPRDVSDGDLP